MAYDEALTARVRATLSGARGMTEKKMFGGLAFLDHGRMCVGVLKDTLVVRLAPAACAKALTRPYTQPMDFTGKPMTGFLYVDAAGLKTERQLSGWISAARAFVSTLPPRKARPKAVRKSRGRGGR